MRATEVFREPERSASPLSALGLGTMENAEWNKEITLLSQKHRLLKPLVSLGIIFKLTLNLYML